MSPKKRSISDGDSLDGTARPAPAKRQRVSLACDACRAAREKCDGGKPTCGTCASQNRTCSYTPTSKKRGVQTGYLRTIELSLSWLFDQVPESEKALHRLLTGDASSLLSKADKTGNRLHKRWCKSRVHKEIGRLLSDNPTPRTDGSVDDSDTDEGAGDSDDSPTVCPDGDRIHLRSKHRNLERPRERSRADYRPRLTRLPPHWGRLLDIYFAYTHCWLPVLERHRITQVAALYPPDGLHLEGEFVTEDQGSHAELWGALAIAAFQDAKGATSSHIPYVPPPEDIFATSRGLLPPDLARWTHCHLRAALLHAIVLLGQGDDLAAWLLVGNITRLALHQRSNGSGRRGSAMDDVSQTLVACSVLDSIIGLKIGQRPQVQAVDELTPFDPTSRVDSDEAWVPLPGMRPDDQRFDRPPATSQPRLSLHQMTRFTQALNASRSGQGKVSPEDLVKTVQPQFSFCNSVIFGGSTPAIPSAFLIQATFLTVTMALLPDRRTSVLSNLMEVVESCVSAFGAHGTPPIFVTLLGVIQQRGQLNHMHDFELERWTTLLDDLKRVWLRPVFTDGSQHKSQLEQPNEMNGLNQTPDTLSFAPSLLTPSYQEGHDLTAPPTVPGYSLPEVEQQAAHTRFAHFERPAKSGTPSRGMMHSGNMGFQSPALGTGHLTPSAYQNPGILTQAIDYDAILEELGSIDCTDSIDVDPQFMTNLGFAPGCDLGDMFQGDLGV